MKGCGKLALTQRLFGIFAPLSLRLDVICDARCKVFNRLVAARQQQAE